MNKYLIIIVILFFMFFSETTETMKAKTYLNTNFNDVRKDINKFLNDVENVTNENLKDKPKKLKKETSDEENLDEENSDEENLDDDNLILNKKKEKKLNLGLDMLWEMKLAKTKDVIKMIKMVLNDANFNQKIIDQANYIVKFINSREDLIKFLPQVNGSEKISYGNIKKLVSKIEPTNFINISKINKKLPVYIRPYNIMIVNNILYQYSPYGVIKYQYRKKTKKDNNMINAVLEATNLNKINKFNSIEAPIFNFRGTLLQNVQNEIFNLETNKKYNLVKELDKSNYWERKEQIDTSKIIETFSETKKINLKNLLYILNKGSEPYLVYPNKVTKEDEFSSKINNVIRENNLTIIGVISRYSFNKNLKYSTLFLCNDNLYFSVTKNIVSKVKDFKKNFGFSISKKIPNYLSCQDQKIILNQLIKENILNKSTSDKMLRKLKCKI